MAGTLYLVATPIGNLEDITRRALRVLGEVDLIACEDTRHTRVLLNHYGIAKKLVSYHEHNERERAKELVGLLEEGSDIALVTDAGMPGVSDPGYRVVRAAIKRNIPVVPLPGATAFVPALVASGLPADEFFFGGFLPSRANARRTRLEELKSIRTTLIFYEAPHRIASTIRDIHEILGERDIVIARELTKMHEEFVRGRASELAERYANSDAETRGELVIIIDRNVIEESQSRSDNSMNIAKRVAELEGEGLDTRAALKRVARESGLARAEVYRRLTIARGR